jgi:sugar phosphate isomerase/epimerase
MSAFISPTGDVSYMFGVSSFCLHHQSLASALDQLAEVTDLVEIMDDGRHYLESADLLENYSLKYSFHAPARSINIACLHEPIRKASIEVIGSSFEVASTVNADIVLHPGYFAWEEEREKALRQFRKSLQELTILAEDCSVRFLLENMGNWNYFFLRQPSEIDVMGDFGLALDVGHANLNHCLDEFLQVPFSHIHLHDNNGVEDSHSPVGTGNIDFDAVMDAVRRDGATPIIEVGTLDGVIESMEALGGR